MNSAPAKVVERVGAARAPFLVSVVIETNQQDDEASIGLLRVLGRLAEQTYRRLEVIVVVHEDATELAHLVEERFPTVRVVWSKLRHKAPMKLRGAAEARGDVIAFLDCDTLPTEIWAERVAETIAGGADVSVGCVRYEPGGRGVRYRNFFDWGHIYGGPDGRASNLTSNCAAFRREVWERHPYDVTLKQFGGCYLLGQELKRAGYRLTLDPEQRVLHLDCYVGREFVIRRLRGGFDSIMVGRRGRATNEAKAARLGPFAPFAIFAGRLSLDFVTLARRRRSFGIRRTELPLFAAAAVGARALELIGALVAVIRPDYFKRRFGW